MSIKEEVNAKIKEAMKAKDMPTLQTLRMLSAAFKQFEIDEGLDLNDDFAMQILHKQIKQRKESAAQYRNSDRTDLAEKEEQELAVLELFLPKQMTEEELHSFLDKAIADSGLERNIRSMSVIMNNVKPQLLGRADFAEVGKYLKEKLS